MLRATLIHSLGLCWKCEADGCALTRLAQAQLEPPSPDVHWNEGAASRENTPQPPLQVYRYNAATVILRENPCATFEAPFMYLLIGSTLALLIDTGDVADKNLMPLAKTVMDLLPVSGSARLPLLVIHTHRQLDQRAGDGQFGFPGVRIIISTSMYLN